MNIKNKPKVLDLFCGCGGMSWGLYKAGFEIVAGIDNWPVALETFKYNNPNSQTFEADMCTLNPETIMDALSLSPGDLDVIVGGPPCQGFSKNVPASWRFLEDPRNQLFRDYLRFIDVFRPKVVIMENVAEIFNAYGGVVKNEISSFLEQLGYQVNVKIINAMEYGVPQKRRRCFFFASNTGIRPNFPLTSTKCLSAWDAISDLPVLFNGQGKDPCEYISEPQNDYQKNLRKDSTVIFDHVAKNLSPIQLQRVLCLEPGQAMKDLPVELQAKSGYSGAYGRLDFQMVSPTITRWVFHPGSGRFYHPKEPRLITIREAARIQSFSDDFRFIGSYQNKAAQVGNAVPPLIMEQLASAIKNCLSATFEIDELSLRSEYV